MIYERDWSHYRKETTWISGQKSYGSFLIRFPNTQAFEPAIFRGSPNENPSRKQFRSLSSPSESDPLFCFRRLPFCLVNSPRETIVLSYPIEKRKGDGEIEWDSQLSPPSLPPLPLLPSPNWVVSGPVEEGALKSPFSNRPSHLSRSFPSYNCVHIHQRVFFLLLLEPSSLWVLLWIMDLNLTRHRHGSFLLLSSSSNCFLRYGYGEKKWETTANAKFPIRFGFPEGDCVPSKCTLQSPEMAIQ